MPNLKGCGMDALHMLYFSSLNFCELLYLFPTLQVRKLSNRSNLNTMMHTTWHSLRPCIFVCIRSLLTVYLQLKKKVKVERKEFRRGIEPGSSGWKARLITIRPRDGLLETECFFIFLNHLNFSRISKIVATAATNAEAYLRELL